MGKTRIIGLLLLTLVGMGSLSGCLWVGLANYATKDIECDAIRSDRARGVTDTTAYMPEKCPELFPAKKENIGVQPVNPKNKPVDETGKELRVPEMDPA
jgi:hypothetical protein